MLYISGKKDMLIDLKEKEGFEGSLTDYAKKFNYINQNIDLKITNSEQSLPPYTPLFPVLQPITLNLQHFDNAREIGKYTFQERQTLKELQEHEIEILALIATKDLLNEYISQFSLIRKKIDEPIIRTPWKFWNENLTVDLIPDMISESFFYKANAIRFSPLFIGLNQLEHDMLAMDALQMQLHSVRNQKGAKAIKVRQGLEAKIRNLSPQIKKQIFPTIQDKFSKHLNSRYSFEELRKMTFSSYGEKMARKGKMKTTYLHLASRSGLNKMREAIPLFKNIGKVAGKSSICLGWASISYDTLDAAINKDLEKSLRTATAGAVGIWSGAAVSAYIIGAAGTTFLVATPFGWAIVVVGGCVAGSLAGNMTSEVVEHVFDGSVNFASQHPAIGETFSAIGNFFYYGFETIGRSLLEDMDY
ncbi:MAG: glycine zipper family protein [Candidatus Protochlamydia sp.]|nr:glycine zipper family protein [Candidatus Protochlamydia sp.]